MRDKGSMRFILAASAALCVAAWSGWSVNSQETSSTKTASSASVKSKKIPATTPSEEARKEFLQGRDLAERLLAQDSIAHFDKAISLDPNFAYAELGRANASQTAKDFFDHLNKAVNLSDKASEGERLQILAVEAGAYGNAPKQKALLDKLIAAYPDDERANFAMGGYYFGQQDYPKAIEYYSKATRLAPDYSAAYNILGYAYRQNGDFAGAERAFKKYIELIPNDPNPYDSYGELLLKMGKFDDSIAQYRKALSINPNFLASHLGISADLMYMGKPDEAAAELGKITEKARSDGDRRTALAGITVVHVDNGNLDKALDDVDKQYALGEKINDAAAMAGDLQTKGNILVEMGKYDQAKEQFDKALKITEGSGLSKEIKDNAALAHHFNLATVALGKNDIKAAKAEAGEFRKGAEASGNPAQIKLSHQLTGTIALAEKDYDKAIAELQKSSDQDPQNLYRQCLAFRGKGDNTRAREFCAKAANFNSLPFLNYAFIRTKAKKMAA
jgi:tetratricopeptide (TPR) repeat protein